MPTAHQAHPGGRGSTVAHHHSESDAETRKPGRNGRHSPDCSRLWKQRPNGGSCGDGDDRSTGYEYSDTSHTNRRCAHAYSGPGPAECHRNNGPGLFSHSSDCDAYDVTFRHSRANDGLNFDARADSHGNTGSANTGSANVDSANVDSASCLHTGRS